MKLTVYTTEGKSSGKSVDVDDSIFAITPNRTVMFEDVRRFLANQRQGTAKTKERSEITGSTRKLFRQKGTGGARRGDIKSPILRGGGTVFGPKPHKYTVGMTRKQIQLARKSALSLKASGDAIRVVERFEFEAPKTQEMVRILQNFELDGKKVLVLTSGKVETVYKSGRNIPGVQVLEANKPATYQIMNADLILVQDDAVELLQEGLKSKFTTPAPKKYEKKESPIAAKKAARATAKAAKASVKAEKATTKAASVKASAEKEEAKAKAASKSTATKAAPAKKAAAKKTTTSKASTKAADAAVEKAPAKKVAAKSTTAKKAAPAKKTTAKSATAKKAAPKTTSKSKKADSDASGEENS